MALVVERVESPTDDARALIAEVDAELNGAYALEQRHGLSVARVFQPGVAFFVARLDGEAVGCGGIAFEDGEGEGDGATAEVKRMYVRPHARGRRYGVAAAILSRLASEARARGMRRLALETGDVQHAAMRFYEREGFTRCGPFGAYAAMPPEAIVRSVFFEKRLG